MTDLAIFGSARAPARGAETFVGATAVEKWDSVSISTGIGLGCIRMRDRVAQIERPLSVQDIDVRCWRCRRLLAEQVTRPWCITCPRCKARNQSEPVEVTNSP